MYACSRFPVLALILVAAAACEPREQDTSPLDTTGGFEDSEDSSDHCDPYDVVINGSGPEPPLVGDTWYFFLHCDGVLLTGPAILQVDPTDFAYIDTKEIKATFLEVGTGTFDLQVGNVADAMDVTVEKGE